MHYVAPPETKVPAPSRGRSQLQSLAMIAIFDVGGPLVLYSLLRSHGFSTVSALVLSGIFPAFGVAMKFVRHRGLDVIGVLVLSGIAVGTVLGLVSHNARLVLLEGSVPTAVFGIVCLASLWWSRPLIYRFAVEFMGPDSPRSREFESLWQYESFRHVFRVMTIVWGLAYLAEAAARVVIVELTSTGTAFAISKVVPYVVTGLLFAWMFAYGSWSKRKGERLAAETEAQEAAAASGSQAPAPETQS